MRLLRKCHFWRLIFLLSLTIFIVILIRYAQRLYLSLYNVAHGELPCFASESTRLNIRHMLFSFHTLMAAENLTYWIDCGTLLGSVRRGGMIPYDHDADAGYLLKDMTQIGQRVAPALSKNFGIDLDQLKPVQMRYQGATVDLFAMATYGNVGLPLPPGKTPNTLTRSFFRVSDDFEQTFADSELGDILPTGKCPFEGAFLRCPNKPKNVLATRYPYTYRWNINVPFKLKCYLNVFDFIRIIIYGE